MAADANNAPLIDLQGEKSCTKCGEVKPLSEFSKRYDYPDKYQSHCNDCARLRSAEHYARNKEKRLAQMSAQRKANPDVRRLSQKIYCEKNKDSILEYHREWAAKNPEKVKLKQDKYRVVNRESRNAAARKREAQKRLEDPEAARERSARWIKTNPEKFREWRKKWVIDNPEKVKASRLAYRSTPHGKISDRIRAGIKKGLKLGGKMGKKTFDALGYSPEELRIHIEKQFIDGMSWGNTKDWHIDHILPLDMFRFDTVDCRDFKSAWSLTNLRPIWAKDNLKKGNKRTLLI